MSLLVAISDALHVIGEIEQNSVLVKRANRNSMLGILARLEFLKEMRTQDSTDSLIRIRTDSNRNTDSDEWLERQSNARGD
jgi:hypothetical protein